MLYCRQTKDGLVDATPEVRKNLEETLNKLKNAYGAESEDLLSVPKLNFNGRFCFSLHRQSHMNRFMHLFF